MHHAPCRGCALTPVKCLTQSDPTFLKTAYGHPLLDLQDSLRFVRRGERYITYQPTSKRWCVYTNAWRAGHPSRHVGSFGSLLRAVFKASQ